MKKFLSILFLLAVAVLPAYSVITTEQIRSADYLEQHGHSDEMARLIDLQNSQINGAPITFVSKDPEWYSEQPFIFVKKIIRHFDKTPENNVFLKDDLNNVQPVKFVRQVFMYWDKGLDDGKFMQNKIKYTERYDDL